MRTNEDIQEALRIADKWADKHEPYRILAAAYRAAIAERDLWKRQYEELAHAYIEQPNEDMPTMFARHEAERKEAH